VDSKTFEINAVYCLKSTTKLTHSTLAKTEIIRKKLFTSCGPTLACK